MKNQKYFDYKIWVDIFNLIGKQKKIFSCDHVLFDMYCNNEFFTAAGHSTNNR